jgi:hypothetical protein
LTHLATSFALPLSIEQNMPEIFVLLQNLQILHPIASDNVKQDQCHHDLAIRPSLTVLAHTDLPIAVAGQILLPEPYPGTRQA